MNVRLCFIAFLCLTVWDAAHVLSQSNLDDDAFEELLRKNEVYYQNWTEGFIDALYEGYDGRKADVKVYWIGDRSRRILSEYGIEGKREHDIVVNRQTFCRFSPHSLQLHCSNRINFPKLSASYRILPTEAWAEVGVGKSIQEWLKWISPKRVVKTQTGYELFKGDQQIVEKCISAVVSGEPLPEPAETERVFRVHFNRHGLLEWNEHIGVLPANTLLLRNEWTDDLLPMPKLLSVRQVSSIDNVPKLQFRITVKQVSNQFPNDAPSLAVPPTDLSFGAKIINEMGERPITTYVGGEAGRAHYELNSSGRRLREALGNQGTDKK